VPPSTLASVGVERGVERLLRGHSDIVAPGGSVDTVVDECPTDERR